MLRGSLANEGVLLVFLRMVRRSIVKGWHKKVLAVMTVTIGTALAVAMLNVSLDIGDKVDRELKDYGANILVIPNVEAIASEIEGVGLGARGIPSYLPDGEVPKLKTIFWSNNIVAFAPFLDVQASAPSGGQVPVIGTWFRKTLVVPTGETVTTGVRDIKSWWQVDGAWPDDESGDALAIVGQAVARQLSLKPGDSLNLAFPIEGSHNHTVKVSGIVSAGGEEDKQVFVPLPWLQEAVELQGQISRLEVSALTIPKNELARKAENDPESLTPEEFEVWYCSAYVDAIAYQIEEAIPGARARPIRQIAESEGIILGRVQLLMALLALAAVVSSALGISNLMGAAALERSKEVGLLKALGAYDSSVTWLFLAEAVLIGLIGGAMGFALGLGLAMFVSENVFRTTLEVKIVTAPAAFAIAVGVTVLGLLSVARVIARLEPARILVGR
ncbi:MAG: ABC transporter permease [Chloroflexi bacterium]|nr:ABC transporter permease [Chloroflexota bacterium]